MFLVEGLKRTQLIGVKIKCKLGCVCMDDARPQDSSVRKDEPVEM